MKKKVRLLIDMDAIMADIYAIWLPWYNKQTGENISPKDIKSYNVDKFVKNPELLKKPFNEKGFFESFPPLPGVITYFQKLIEDEKFEVIVVTQPPRESDFAIKEKREWIKTFFPSFPLENMVFCHKKHLISGDLLFDDKPSHLWDWRFEHDGMVATIDYPYNKIVKSLFGDGIKIFSKNTAWRDFYQFVKEYYR